MGHDESDGQPEGAAQAQVEPGPAPGKVRDGNESVGHVGSP